jgi:hypothetical protein
MNTIEYIKHHVHFIRTFENIELSEAYNRLLSYCAYEGGVYGAVFKAKLTTSDYLKKEFDLSLIRGFDYLGESYKELGLAKTKTIKSKIAYDDEKIAQITEDIKCVTEDISIPTVFLQNVGTGKILFNINRNVPKCLMYAVEEEKILYKICLVNIQLNKLPVKLLDTYEENLTPKSEAWRMANIY